MLLVREDLLEHFGTSSWFLLSLLEPLSKLVEFYVLEDIIAIF